LLDHALSEVIELTSDGNKEFIDAEFTIVILIKEIKEMSAFILADFNSEVVHCFPELLDIERITVIIIHNFEDSLEANHSSSTSSSEHVSYLDNQLIVRILDSSVVDLVVVRVDLSSSSGLVSLCSLAVMSLLR
jgi:hypothetical protein